jgi:aryl-alcohol dehydrogenase-like predicted oxidoreductase
VQTRSIGSLQVSVVGLGCNNFGWRLDEVETRAVVDAALDAGVTLLDTADIYGETESETFLGRILRGRRDRVVLATKFGKPGGHALAGGASPAYVRRAVDASLRRLRTDRIDLYQLHEPRPETPIVETLGVLEELVRAGKVREIGCSNFSAAQLREADRARTGSVRFECVQNELNALDRADVDDALAEAERLAIAYLPYYPLANGLLTGKYRRGQPPAEGSRLQVWFDEHERLEVLSDDRFDRVEALQEIAAAHGLTLLELAVGWLLAHAPVASVIAGATTPEQVRANAGAADRAATVAEVVALAGV